MLRLRSLSLLTQYKGLCRLTVIRIALAVARPQAVSVDVVPRGAVSRPHLLQKGNGGFLAVGKGELCDKAAFFLFIFAGGCAPTVR